MRGKRRRKRKRKRRRRRRRRRKGGSRKGEVGRGKGEGGRKFKMPFHELFPWNHLKRMQSNFCYTPRIRMNHERSRQISDSV